MTEPKTVAEQLDAAPDGQAFGQVILNLFTTLESLMDAEEQP
jgi:hypothetical protein